MVAIGAAVAACAAWSASVDSAVVSAESEVDLRPAKESLRGGGRGDRANATNPEDVFRDNIVPLPDAPGMDKANLVVHVMAERATVTPPTSGAVGTALLLEQSGGDILAMMAQDGWDIAPMDAEGSYFEVLMPAVRFAMPGAVVRIPRPRLISTVHDTRRSIGGGLFERMQGDLVLQNGEGLLTLELFSRKLSVSAAGWTRSSIGREGDGIYIFNEVEVGLRVPKVPGIASLLQLFVKSYARHSTRVATAALAKAADNLAAKAQER